MAWKSHRCGLSITNRIFSKNRSSCVLRNRTVVNESRRKYRFSCVRVRRGWGYIIMPLLVDAYNIVSFAWGPLLLYLLRNNNKRTRCMRMVLRKPEKKSHMIYIPIALPPNRWRSQWSYLLHTRIHIIIMYYTHIVIIMTTIIIIIIWLSSACNLLFL